MQNLIIIISVIILILLALNLPAFFLRKWNLNLKTKPKNVKCYISSFTGLKKIDKGVNVKIDAILFPKRKAPRGKKRIKLFVVITDTLEPLKHKVTIYTDAKKKNVFTFCDLKYEDIIIVSSSTPKTKNTKSKLFMKWTFPNGIVLDYST